MTDDVRTDEESSPLATPEPAEGIVSDAACVASAPADGAIVTEDDRARSVAPEVFAADQAAPMLEALVALGETIHRRLDALQTLFEREVRAEATRERVVDRLHAELQEYKQDLLLNVLRPVFVDLIQLHDDIGRIVDARPESEGETRRLLDLMRGFQQGIEDILYRQGVEPFVQEGDAFDPRRQRAVATVPTDDLSLARKIAMRHRKGFQALPSEKVIRPEIVSVYAQKK
jgi:molecular chaperone GrpE